MAEHEGRMSEAVIGQSRQGLRLMAAGEYLDLFRTDNSIKVYEKNIALTTKLIAEINAKREQAWHWLPMSRDMNSGWKC